MYEEQTRPYGPQTARVAHHIFKHGSGRLVIFAAHTPPGFSSPRGPHPRGVQPHCPGPEEGTVKTHLLPPPHAPPPAPPRGPSPPPAPPGPSVPAPRAAPLTAPGLLRGARRQP